MYQQATSGEAYRSIKPHLNPKEQEVLEAIKTLCNKFGSCNDRMIREFLGGMLNSAARRNALVSKGIIYESHKAVDNITGKTTSYWRVATKQLNIF